MAQGSLDVAFERTHEAGDLEALGQLALVMGLAEGEESL